MYINPVFIRHTGYASIRGVYQLGAFTCTGISMSFYWPDCEAKSGL